MENLKQSYLLARQWIVSKLSAISSNFARHFIAWLIVLIIPPLILAGILLLQSRKVEQYTALPLLAKTQVKKLERQVATSQRQVAIYKHEADSLHIQAAIHEQKAQQYQQAADSLLLHYHEIPLTSSLASTAQLQQFLTTYRPGPDSL